MASIVISIVSQLLVYLFVTLIAKPLLQLALNGIPNWISAAFFIESQFEDIEGFDLSGICNALFTFALAYLVLFFIVKLIQVYFSWTNGDPETSPMTVLLGFMKALIVMLAFGTLYEYFVQIIYSMYNMLLQNGFGGIPSVDDISFSGSALNLLGAIIVMITAVITLVVYIGVLARGIQLLLLRLGIVFAAIGLLNADGGAFKGYIKKFISNAFSILVQIFLICLATRLLASSHWLLALLTASTALKGADMLNEFLQKTGFVGEQGLTSAMAQTGQAMHTVSKIHSGMASGTGKLLSGGAAVGRTVGNVGGYLASKTPVGKAAGSAKQSIRNAIGKTPVGKVGKGISAVREDYSKYMAGKRGGGSGNNISNTTNKLSSADNNKKKM